MSFSPSTGFGRVRLRPSLLARVAPGNLACYGLCMHTISICFVFFLLRLRAKLISWTFASWYYVTFPLVVAACIAYVTWVSVAYNSGWFSSSSRPGKVANFFFLVVVVPAVPTPLYIALHNFLQWTDGAEMTGKHVGHWVLVCAWVPLLLVVCMVVFETLHCYIADSSAIVRNDRLLHYLAASGLGTLSIGCFIFSNKITDKMDGSAEVWISVTQPLVLGIGAHAFLFFLRSTFVHCLMSPSFFYPVRMKSRMWILAMAVCGVELSIVMFVIQSAHYADALAIVRASADITRRWTTLSPSSVYISLVGVPITTSIFGCALMLPLYRWCFVSRQVALFARPHNLLDLQTYTDDPYLAEYIANVFSNRDIVVTDRRNTDTVVGNRGDGVVSGSGHDDDDTVSEVSIATSATGVFACAVCMTRTINAAFVPCGHVCCCIRCAKRLSATECPICRKYVSTVVKLYFTTGMSPAQLTAGRGGSPVPGRRGSNIPLIPHSASLTRQQFVSSPSFPSPSPATVWTANGSGVGNINNNNNINSININNSNNNAVDSRLTFSLSPLLSSSLSSTFGVLPSVQPPLNNVGAVTSVSSIPDQLPPGRDSLTDLRGDPQLDNGQRQSTPETRLNILNTPPNNANSSDGMPITTITNHTSSSSSTNNPNVSQPNHNNNTASDAHSTTTTTHTTFSPQLGSNTSDILVNESTRDPSGTTIGNPNVSNTNRFQADGIRRDSAEGGNRRESAFSAMEDDDVYNILPGTPSHSITHAKHNGTQRRLTSSTVNSIGPIAGGYGSPSALTPAHSFRRNNSSVSEMAPPDLVLQTRRRSSVDNNRRGSEPYANLPPLPPQPPPTTQTGTSSAPSRESRLGDISGSLNANSG